MAFSTSVAAGVNMIPIKEAPNTYQSGTQFKSFLAEHSALLSEADIEIRQSAFALLKSIVSRTPSYASPMVTLY